MSSPQVSASGVSHGHGAHGGGLHFHATDSSGHNFSSPFGDLQLLPSDLQAALSRGLGSSLQGSVGAQSSAIVGGIDSDDEDEEDDGGDPDEVASPRIRDAKQSNNAKSPAAVAMTPKTSRRGSKAPSSSSVTSSGSSTKGKERSAASQPDTSKAEDATPKAANKGKAKSTDASTPTAGGKTASGTPAPGSAASAAASAAKKKSGKPGSEVKGERDSVTGRRKIKIQFIEDDSRRHITFSKRKSGIMKKVSGCGL